MRVDSLVRDKSLVNTAFKIVDDKMIALKPLTIHIPVRFIAAKLAVISERIMVAGVYAIVCGTKYVVGNFPVMQQITPSSISTDVINEEDYYLFEFNQGDIISPRVDVVVEDDTSFNLFNEFLGKAKLPWYYGYEDLGKCLMATHHFGGLTLAPNNIPFELIAAMIARSKDNRKQYYREVASSMKDTITNPPQIIPFRSIVENTTNTIGKITGAYFDEGLVSALTTESGPAGVEDLLRL